MSRIGKQPITIPKEVTITIEGSSIRVVGPKGTLEYSIHPDIHVEMKDGTIVCSIARPTKRSNALWGTVRANITNMVHGVVHGFQKKLELHGVGYRAAVKGKNLELSVGYSHPVIIQPPEGIAFSVEKELVTVEGYDATVVGQIAADIRKVREPEPYKGKGIRYVDEVVRRKAGKVVGSTE